MRNAKFLESVIESPGNGKIKVLRLENGPRPQRNKVRIKFGVCSEKIKPKNTKEENGKSRSKIGRNERGEKPSNQT